MLSQRAQSLGSGVMLCQITCQPAPLNRECGAPQSAVCHDAAGEGTAAVEGFLFTCGVKQIPAFVQQRQHQSTEAHNMKRPSAGHHVLRRVTMRTSCIPAPTTQSKFPSSASASASAVSTLRVSLNMAWASATSQASDACVGVSCVAKSK